MLRKKLSPFFVNSKYIEGITLGKKRRKKLAGNNLVDFKSSGDFANSFEYSKFLIFYFIIAVVVFIFFIRLFILTIVQGEKNRNLADNNRIRLINVETERGKIFDRNGVLLASSKKIYLLHKDLRITEISQSTGKIIFGRPKF